MAERELHMVTGAAGFIGSHLVDRLLAQGHEVFGLDNFTRGVEQNLAAARSSPAFTFAEIDVNDETALRAALAAKGPQSTMIWHLAANSDIAAGLADPAIDLRDTFMTTFAVAQTCRAFSIRNLAFASTSAIYGDHGPVALREDAGPLFPISNYGAMKLAAEACLTALAESSLDHLWLFRFPNVVGGRATHGVVHDFLDRLAIDPTKLQVLGDGSQCKPYLHVDDLLKAMELIVAKAAARVNCYNIGPADSGVTVRDIAELVVARAAPGARVQYGAQGRGWVGDVPQFHYAVDKILALGWRPKCQTSREALERAVDAQIAERLEAQPKETAP